MPARLNSQPPTTAPTMPRTMSRIKPSPVLFTSLLPMNPAISPRTIQAMIDMTGSPFLVYAWRPLATELRSRFRSPRRGAPSLHRGQDEGLAGAKIPEEVAPQVVGFTEPLEEKVLGVPGVVDLMEIGNRTFHHGRRQQGQRVVPAWLQRQSIEVHRRRPGPLSAGQRLSRRMPPPFAPGGRARSTTRRRPSRSFPLRRAIAASASVTIAIATN